MSRPVSLFVLPVMVMVMVAALVTTALKVFATLGPRIETDKRVAPSIPFVY